MRDREDEIREAGASIGAVGMGWPQAAAAFKADFRISFPLLVDHTKETYRALEMERGTLWQVAGPPVWIRGAKNILSGKSQSLKPKQDPLQLGGTVVVGSSGESLLVHRSKTSDENLPLDDVLAVLRKAR